MLEPCFQAVGRDALIDATFKKELARWESKRGGQLEYWEKIQLKEEVRKQLTKKLSSHILWLHPRGTADE